MNTHFDLLVPFKLDLIFNEIVFSANWTLRGWYQGLFCCYWWRLGKYPFHHWHDSCLWLIILFLQILITSSFLHFLKLIVFLSNFSNFLPDQVTHSDNACLHLFLPNDCFGSAQFISRFLLLREGTCWIWWSLACRQSLDWLVLGCYFSSLIWGCWLMGSSVHNFI